jgi:hypothetical protein
MAFQADPLLGAMGEPRGSMCRRIKASVSGILSSQSNPINLLTMNGT